jgi:hypothetical protein
MAQRLDGIKRIAEAVPVGGLRHELRDPFRALLLKARALKRLSCQITRAKKSSLLQCAANIIGCGWWRGRFCDLVTHRRRDSARLCIGMRVSEGEHTGKQRASQSPLLGTHSTDTANIASCAVRKPRRWSRPDAPHRLPLIPQSGKMPR